MKPQHQVDNRSRLPRAIVVDLAHPRISRDDAAYRLKEVRGLVDTFGGIIVVHTLQKRENPDGRTFVGKGKVEEIARLVLGEHRHRQRYGQGAAAVRDRAAAPPAP